MTWAAGLALLRRFWPALPIIALALWAARLDQLRGDHLADLTQERTERRADNEAAKASAARLEASYAQQSATAATSYADRLAAREPIILKSIDTVREYAQTAAGRAACLGADRVRGIDALDAGLFAESPAGAIGSEEAVPSDSGAPPTGR